MSLVRQGNHSSLGHRVDVSAIDVNDVPPNEYLHGVTCGQNIISLQGLRYQESRQGRLHWLEAVSLCNGESSKEDLEAPVVVETDIYGEDSIERRREDSPHEGLIKAAAEALAAISSSQTHDMQDDATGCKMDASQTDSPRSFAEIISSCHGSLDNGSAAEVKRIASEESFPDVTDYFEHMTLSLVETKEERPCYVPPNSDNLIEEVTLSKRPRRGQSRRGRQQKDFQRDVLPGLVSLSKNEVTDDLQIIEGLIRESGGSWQSSLSERNSGKGGRGRGRKRMGTSAPSTTVAEVNQPQIEQPKCVELQGPEERNLTCWGKRTRRPPRQRYPIDNSPIPLK